MSSSPDGENENIIKSSYHSQLFIIGSYNSTSCFEDINSSSKDTRWIFLQSGFSKGFFYFSLSLTGCCSCTWSAAVFTVHTPVIPTKRTKKYYLTLTNSKHYIGYRKKKEVRTVETPNIGERRRLIGICRGVFFFSAGRVVHVNGMEYYWT